MNIFAIAPMYSAYIHDHYFIFILALLSLAVLIVLRSKVVFLIQLAFLVTMILVDQASLAWLMNILLFTQIILTLIAAHRIKNAIDRSYKLVLEKTHAVKRHFTNNDYTTNQK